MPLALDLRFSEVRRRSRRTVGYLVTPLKLSQLESEFEDCRAPVCLLALILKGIWPTVNS